jgi:glycosyltransferase involved in cell wall biosynthesis
MSAGKPILAVSDRESELSQVVEEENIGWVVEPEMPDLIAKVVMEARINRELLSQMSIRARTLAIEKYSLPASNQRYKILVDSVVLNDKSILQGIK